MFSFVCLLPGTMDTNSNQMKTILKRNNVTHLRKCHKRRKDNPLLIQYSKEPSEISVWMLYSSPLWRGSLSWLTLPELWAADKENMLQWQLCHPARMKYAQFPSPRLALCLCLGQLFEICGEVLLLIQNFCWTFVTGFIGVSRLWKWTRISLTCSLSCWEVPKILKQSSWLRSGPRQCASRHAFSA